MTFSLDQARMYIAGVRWQFAKTMPQWPHEYTVRQWRPDLEPAFLAFAALIRSDGMVRPWPRDAATPRYRHLYLDVDGSEYWTMGAPIPQTTVINRARTKSFPASRSCSIGRQTPVAQCLTLAP